MAVRWPRSVFNGVNFCCPPSRISVVGGGEGKDVVDYSEEQLLGSGVNAMTLRLSLWNDPSEGARCVTLGMSVARSWHLRRPSGSRWEIQAAFLLLLASECRQKGRSGKTLGYSVACTGCSVALGKLRHGFCERLKCGPQQRSVAPSGMLRQIGRGVKR